VLDFLMSFKEAADLNEVSEAATAVLLPYFLEGRANSGLSSRMKHIPASMPKFPAAVQWLLQYFATEAIIAASYQKVFIARQSVEEDEKQFASRLTQYAAEAGSVFSEDSLISAFVDGLQPYASNTVRGEVTTTMTFAEVQLLAEQGGTASRALPPLAKASPRLVIRYFIRFDRVPSLPRPRNHTSAVRKCTPVGVRRCRLPNNLWPMRNTCMMQKCVPITRQTIRSRHLPHRSPPRPETGSVPVPSIHCRSRRMPSTG
jgi:hypothetical protein